MNMEIVKAQLNASYVIAVCNAVYDARLWDRGIAERFMGVRTAVCEPFNEDWDMDCIGEDFEGMSVIDLAGLTIFTPTEEDLEDDNLFADVQGDDDLRVHVDDMHCAFEPLDSLDDRECASGLFS